MDESLLITRDNKVVNLKEDGTWEYATSLQSSLDTWQDIEQTPAALAFFKDLFNRAGVRVLDTNEAFTCVQTGRSIEFIAGESSVFFVSTGTRWIE